MRHRRAVMAVVVAAALVAAGSAAAGRPSQSRFVTCGGQAFRLSALTSTQGRERARTGPASALRAFFRSRYAPPPYMMARHGWRILRRTAHRALFALGSPPDMQTVVVALQDGRWKWRGWAAGCHPRAVRNHVTASPWRIDHSFPAPGRRARTIHVLVHEISCASSRDARGRIQRPSIWLDRDRVYVATFVTPIPADAYCTGNPETPFAVHLSAPLRERRLVDVGAVPWHRRR